VLESVHVAGTGRENVDPRAVGRKAMTVAGSAIVGAIVMIANVNEGWIQL
jgi:hypothetical protein